MKIIILIEAAQINHPFWIRILLVETSPITVKNEVITTITALLEFCAYYMLPSLTLISMLCYPRY